MSNFDPAQKYSRPCREARLDDRRAATKQLFEYLAADGSLAYQVERTDLPDGTKNFWQQRPGGDGRWIPNLNGVDPVPYRLPELIEAVGQGQRIVIVEGERKVDLLRSWGVPATCNSSGACKWRAEHSKHLTGADVVILPDNDDAGRKHAEVVAASLMGVDAEVRILELPGLGPKGDIVDWARDGGTVEKLYELIETSARPWLKAKSNGHADRSGTRNRTGGGHRNGGGAPCGAAEEASAEPLSDAEFDVEITKLSAMSLAKYERARTDAAARLGVRAPILDKIVAAKRPCDASLEGQGRPLDFVEPDPWPAPIEGAELLSELRNTIKKFLVCSPPKTAAIALWIAATWFEPAAQVAPILNIRSPLPRCGKTTLLDLIRRLSKRPLAASSITAAALFRTVEKCCPTLVIDEADSFFSENEEMRGVLNSGHTRQTAFVIRTVGEDHEPRQFSTWGFKAIAGIGKRAGTIEDRSVAIDLERKLRGEQVSRLRHAPDGLFSTLQQKLCRWSSDNGEAVARARPSLPEALNDRQQDNWEILVAIADLAGGEWPALVRNAALSLSNAKDDAEPFVGHLLMDIQDIVKGSIGHGVHSRDLLDRLVAMSERPWGECNHGKPLTQNKLAKMLGAFGLRTKDLRLGGVVQRGYDIDELQAAFSRYCPDPGVQSDTVPQSNEINCLDQKQSATGGGGVAFQNQSNILKNKGCSTVAQTGDERETGGFDGQWRTEL